MLVLVARHREARGTVTSLSCTHPGSQRPHLSMDQRVSPLMAAQPPLQDF